MTCLAFRLYWWSTLVTLRLFPIGPVVVVLIATALAVVLRPETTWAGEWTLEVRRGDQIIQGMPVDWSQREVLLLARDGSFWTLDLGSITAYRKLADQFYPYSMMELRSQLRGEFGTEYDITTSTHYLVVHPVGQRDVWNARFEQFYRAFYRYFRLRGWAGQEPQFPLVAIVLRDQQAYFRYARQWQIPITQEIVGYYCPRTNRIVMYDLSTTHFSNKDAVWETVFHEAAHQIAFNSGLHDRRFPPPRWVVEGLGMLFEVRTVWDPSAQGTLKDRINVYRLQRLRSFLPRRPRGALVETIRSDRRFTSDPDAAYAEAWALTFFLAERRPQQYLEYLRRTAADSRASSEDSRWRQFADVFGQNALLLEAQYLQFVSDLLLDVERGKR